MGEICKLIDGPLAGEDYVLDSVPDIIEIVYPRGVRLDAPRTIIYYFAGYGSKSDSHLYTCREDAKA